LFEKGIIKPVIDKSFPLEKTVDAFRYYEQGGFKGKIVIAMQ
jgi:NADPH:quinone reductase-like Zn-dependent oxidoreductase